VLNRRITSRVSRDACAWVSWHVHLLAWGESKSAIRTRIEDLNKKGISLPIADGLAAAHQKQISRGKLADKSVTC
jgi:hypothetical protein